MMASELLVHSLPSWPARLPPTPVSLRASPDQPLKIVRLLDPHLPIPLHRGDAQFWRVFLPPHCRSPSLCLLIPPLLLLLLLLFLNSPLHHSRRRLRDLIHLPVCQDVGDAASAGLDQDGGWARELEEETVAPDGSAGPGADAVGEVG